MKKFSLFFVLMGFMGIVFGQNTFPASGNVGIGTSSPTALLDVFNSNYSGFFLRSSTGAAQFRFRANVGAFVFDDANNNLRAKIEYNGPSKQLNLVNQQSGSILLTTNNQNLYFTGAGRLGIGTLTPSRTLSVNGSMEAEEIEVKQNVADYVFYPEYELMPLGDLKEYIQQNGHLPNIQTQKDVDDNQGLVKVGELSVSLMEKVEELTLHLIRLNERLEALERENKTLGKEVRK